MPLTEKKKSPSRSGASAPDPTAYAVHWFRRDLRLTGNAAVSELAETYGGRVLGFFCIDPAILERPDFSHHRFAFFLKTLRVVQEEFSAAGSELLVLPDGPDEAFRRLFKLLEASGAGLPAELTYHRDYEPFARARDAHVENLVYSEFSVNVRSFRDHLLIEPMELTKNGGGVYQVYGAFKKKWLQLFESEEIESRRKKTARGLRADSPKLTCPVPETVLRELRALDPLPGLELKLAERLTRAGLTLPAAGHAAAIDQVQRFKKHALADYDHGRDVPGVAGTSQLSIYFKNGSITVPQVIELLDLHAKSPHLKYFQELIWREFYYHILYHFPEVAERPFDARYAALEWENRPDSFQSWCEGKTGYPIVDAGMRQLNATGWMHNRVRMIVASFLTKDLLIDYRWGERYFMEKLLDGDLAPNNGGWQWGASTGCDPQPYFRIFNPISQGLRFDPEGTYIRHWVPELAGLSKKELHAPQPNAVVDHATQRARALRMFKDARARTKT